MIGESTIRDLGCGSDPYSCKDTWAWPVGFDLFWPFELGCWAKGHGTHNASLFPVGETFPTGKILYS